MHSKLFLFSLFILLYISSFAQKEDYNWTLSNNVLINFNTLPPTVSTNIQNITYGISCISDKNGNLLFYGDGLGVYDGSNNLLYSLPDSLGRQFKCIILAKPNSSTEYFAFIEALQFSAITIKHYVIQLELKTNNMVGELISSEIFQSEKMSNLYLMQVMRHENNIDFWLLTTGFNSKQIDAYLITENNIELKRTSTFENNVSIYNSNIKVSPDMSSILYVRNDTLTSLDFDNSSGLLSNMQQIKLNGFAFQFEFSPNADKIYISSSSTIYDSLYIKQYSTALLNNEAAFYSSEKIVFKLKGGRIWDMQISPNNEILILHSFSGYLGKILNADSEPPTCNFSANEIYLNGKICRFFPLFLRYRSNFSQTVNCNTIHFKYIGASPLAILWNFGDSQTSTEENPSHNYALPGKYTVTLKVTYTDNSEKIITKEIKVDQKPDIPIINY